MKIVKRLFSFSVETVPQTVQSVMRNKRRSFAMLAGIVLVSMLLSGLMLFSSQLSRDNYEGIVGNTPYEVEFNILGDGQETYHNLTQLRDEVLADQRTMDAEIMAGGYQLFGRRNIGRVAFNTSSFNATGDYYPLFADDTFFSSKIGDVFTGLDYEGNRSLPEDGVIIPQRVALEYGLEIGMTLTFNFTLTILKNNNPASFAGTVKNLTVVGTYRAFEFTGLDFSTFNGFTGINFLFNIHLMERPELEEFNRGMIEKGNYFVAAKIDASKFTVEDPNLFNQELNRYINDISKTDKMDVEGENRVDIILIGFQIYSVILTILYVIIATPVVLLSLYLLNFGLEMSLEERRREIAIKKVQGADSGQIFADLRNESVLLLIIGSIIGYLIGIVAAYVISAAVGFMKLNFANAVPFSKFFRFDSGAFFTPFFVAGIETFIAVYRKGKQFIEQEVTQGVARYEAKKESFWVRTKLDLVIFGLGLAGIVIVILDILKISYTLPTALQASLGLVSPFALWAGGASVGSRVVKIVPTKLEKYYLRIPTFRDVRRMIKSGLKRRGDVDRLAIIIILTLSITALSTIQGNTEEHVAIRNLEWEIGSEFRVDFTNPGLHGSELQAISNFRDSTAMYLSAAKVYSSGVQLVAYQNEKEYQNMKENEGVLFWQQDSFRYQTPETAMQLLHDNPRGAFVSPEFVFETSLKVGDRFDLRITQITESGVQTVKVKDITVLGEVNQLPGGVSGSLLISEQLMKEVYARSVGLDFDLIKNQELPAQTYLFTTTVGNKVTNAQIKDIEKQLAANPNVKTYRSFYKELRTLNTRKSGFGVSGLLSLNFVVSLTASVVSAFSFSAILIERRRQEFAILRAIGATKVQIYKLALGENTMMMTVATVWGALIGIGISYLFNIIFVFLGLLLGTLTAVPREVVVPWGELLLISFVTLFGMLVATMLSIRSAANQDLSLATRVI